MQCYALASRFQQVGNAQRRRHHRHGLATRRILAGNGRSYQMRLRKGIIRPGHLARCRRQLCWCLQLIQVSGPGSARGQASSVRKRLAVDSSRGPGATRPDSRPHTWLRQSHWQELRQQRNTALTGKKSPRRPVALFFISVVSYQASGTREICGKLSFRSRRVGRETLDRRIRIRRTRRNSFNFGIIPCDHKQNPVGFTPTLSLLALRVLVSSVMHAAQDTTRHVRNLLGDSAAIRRLHQPSPEEAYKRRRVLRCCFQLSSRFRATHGQHNASFRLSSKYLRSAYGRYLPRAWRADRSKQAALFMIGNGHDSSQFPGLSALPGRCHWRPIWPRWTWRACFPKAKMKMLDIALLCASSQIRGTTGDPPLAQLRTRIHQLRSAPPCPRAAALLKGKGLNTHSDILLPPPPPRKPIQRVCASPDPVRCEPSSRPCRRVMDLPACWRASRARTAADPDAAAPQHLLGAVRRP